jgi:Rhodopirellula transposase DDE domain
MAEPHGAQAFPDARELTITADCGGSNGARVRVWKIELQRFADETGLVLNVHHYPPGTSRGVGRRDCTSSLSQNGA